MVARQSNKPKVNSLAKHSPNLSHHFLRHKFNRTNRFPYFQKGGGGYSVSKQRASPYSNQANLWHSEGLEILQLPLVRTST